MEQLESMPIPRTLKYSELSNITIEAREKLDKIQPLNIGQASRISGVSPADISVLMVLLKKQPLASGA
jgi:tRNA uridine 5-carboxymethylaminomethyl modification enzyme